MEPISNPTPQVVNRFFTVAQILAFNQPPMKEALKTVAVGGGSSAEYLEGEYIRLVLNMLVGQGMWELKTKVDSYDVRTVKKQLFDNNRRKTGTEDWLGVSAVIHTQLIISARDGSEAKLIFEANAVGDGMSHPDKGISSALDLAVKSAETDTLKRCSQNLGRVFGLDLKNKVTKNMLPLTVKHFEERLAARNAAIAANDHGVRTIEHAPAAIEDHSKAESENTVENAASEPEARQQAADKAESAQPAATSPKPVDQAPATKVVSEPKAASTDTVPASRAADRNDNRRQQASSRPDQASDATQQQEPAIKSPDDFEPWELSLIPSDFDEWDRCVKTMVARLALMTLHDELTNFIRRHDKIIKKFPIIAATDDIPEKNFVRRWDRIVERKRAAIDAKIQAEGAKAA